MIQQRLLGDSHDVEALVRGCRRAREIFAAPALRPHVHSELSPGPAVDRDDQWEEHLRQHTFRLFHPVATCRMGSDARSVVDPRLRVRGTTCLRVIDASVMPALPSGNTNAPAIMIAEKGSDLVRDAAVTTATA